MADVWIIAVPLLVAINAITILCFWSDKQRAIAGDRRIREADLLLLAMAGGSPGALYARRAFRHKTRKDPFSTKLALICVVQVGGLIGFAIL